MRAVVDPLGDVMHRTQLDDSRIELPRIDGRLIGRQHRWAAVASGGGDIGLLPGEYDAIRWYDTEDGTGASMLRRAGDLSVGEPVFAPSTGNVSDGNGYGMTYATDRADVSNWLLVIPADNPGSGPHPRTRTAWRARQLAPHRGADAQSATGSV